MKLEVFKSSYGYYNLRTIDGKPTEEMSNYLKQNGYYWSRNNNCWYPGTSAAKNTEANEKFVEDFRKKFFEPAEQEQKSFGQELFEREQRKTAWREVHGLETKQEHSEENISNDERITYLETLINELREERKRDQEKIARLEFELANNRDEGLADFYSQQEQQQLDDEAEWEKENTLTEEEEQAIIDEHNEIPSEIILDSAEAINTIGEIMEEAAREEEPQAENDFMESSFNEEDPEVEVSPEELSLAKSVLPTSQYVSTLRFSQGEEGNFFKQKLKEIAEVVNKAPKLYETDGAEQHPIVLRYFHPTGTETLVTEIGEDGEAYGFQCLNGDYEMAEWGYLNLNEIKSIRMMEIDYHVEKGMTVERWLYKEQPDMFPQYAKFAEQLEEKSPMDIANETGNDVEAIAKALNNQNENEIIVDSQQLADELFDKVTNRYYEENKDFFDTYEKVKEAHIENESRYVGDARIRHNFEQYHEELVKMQLQELTDIIKEADSQEIASKAATRYFNAFGADRYSYYGSLYSITKLAHYESGKLIYPTPEELQSFIKETYNDLHGIVEEKEQENVSNKPFNFFINDAANLDLGIGAEIEPITGLTAEQAAVKYAELKDKGLSPYIGINIPGDFVFDDKEGQGAGIFTEVNGRPSFYMGDNFVKDLNEFDEHAKNVLAAYKELYEMTDKYILGVERPDFVFEKENEFSGNKEYDFTKPINISERFAIDFVNHGYKENTVRFIDRKNNQITTGQYLVSTIADRKGNSELILDMGVSAWTVDAESMKKAEEICRYYRYNHITVTSSFEENIELEAENGERMPPEQLNQRNEEQKLQHSQDAELDDLAEGKQFSMEAAMQSVENDNKKMNFVLDKLAAAGIEVVSSKAEFDNILKNHNILQKMETSSTEEKNPLFLADEKELKAFAQKVDDWKAGKLSSTEFISVFSTSTVLQAINIPANKVSITQDVLKKINELETVKVGKSYGHDIDITTIKKIPEFLADPVMVFNSASTPGNYVIMSETVDKKNRTIMVAMEINKKDRSLIVNNITSAYGRNDNNFFIEQIKLGNLLYQNKQKSLEWTSERGLPLPSRLTTQGSLNVIQKEDIVNKKTPNFSFSERHLAFTENQQDFLRELGFTNSVDGDNSVLDWKMSKTIPETNKIIYFETGPNRGSVNCFACYEIDESKDNIIRTDLLRRYAEEKNAFEGFLTSISFYDRQNNFIVPYEKLGKVLSDEILEKLTDYIDDKAPKISRENFSNDIIDVAFKNKVSNLPAKFISEDIYSSGINPVGKELTFKVYKEVLKIAGVPVDDKKHYLLKIQTDNNYEYVHNKAYPRLYEAKWNRIKQVYTDEVELNLNSFNSKTIGNIQYIAANNCNYPNPPAQTMTLSDGKTYGFAYEAKIYLNPEIWNSEVAVHEYTHLWDNYIQRTNPELWEKGKSIFKNTNFWEEVKADPNYADISDNDDLLLSEVHAQICGKMADAILTKIAERDGELTKDTVIDWDNEVWDYMQKEFGFSSSITQSVFNTQDVKEFLSTPMKDLMNGIQITKRYYEEKTVEPEQLTSKKDIKAIREQCREILEKPDSEITEADKIILAQYEGAGGLNEVNRTNAGILNEFYTPNNLVEKVWQIVDAYAPNAKTVLEPSAGVGKFANNRPDNEFTMHELDETSARINKILHPEANVIQGAYQKQFFDEGERVRLSSYQQPKYDVVIGNPPYGKYNDKYKGLGEGKEFDRYEEYFIDKGLDALKDENSLLAFVVPSGFLDTVNDKQKEIIASKGKLIDAYRLPVGTFPTTDVGTDIIIMTSWEKDRNEIDLKNQLVGVKAHAQLTNERLKKRQENYLNNLSSGEWFKQHPEKILGEVKTRTNRFGKIEEYVAVHEGLTVQDELNKIDSMLPNLDRQMSVENKQKNEQSNIPIESISKAFSDIYKDSPEKATESTQEFTEALEQMDFHKLGHFMLWGVAGGDEISEPVKAATRNIFENYTGKSFPVFENIDDETEKRHLTQLWLAKNTNVAHIDTWNKCYDLHSEQDVLEYLVSRGSGTQGGKERINKFFERNSNDQERIKFLINEYGWFGSYDSVFEMQCNNNSKGIKVTAYITNPETEEVTKFDRMVSWKEICNEIKRQRLLEIYLDKPIEKTVSEENNKSQSKEVQQETTKTKTPRAKKEKWNIAKSKGEVMTAQEFSHFYGRDFDEREFPIWAATDWQGNIDLSKLSAEDLTYMEQSGNYVCKQINKGEPEWTHKVLFTTGDIYAKIQEQRELLAELNTQVADDSTYETQKAIYEKNIALLEASKKEPLDMEHIHFGLKSTLAEEFTIPQFDGDGNEIEVNLQESFILWAQGQTLANRSNWRGYIDFATANISREELGEDISFSDIVQYIDGKPVKADAVRGWRTYRMTDEEKKAEKAERKKEADLKRQARADIANKLFDRYLHEGLEPDTRKKLEDEYNRRFNSYIIPDYSKLPLFVNGMSAYKGESKFKLYEQQIKGISFLCNKGNGLLAYDVGVGKTAAGIVATVNQIQTVRSKRPLIIVPNQVYSKWYTDIKQLFPNVKVNDLYNFNKQSVEKYIDSENPHKLNIPENSISLCTYEALKNITFTDESCENELYKDFANLLSADMDGSDRENAESSDKIKGIIGSASHVKDESYYFFEDCGFDHLTVDEAHNFKNLWVVPRPKKKGESNEYSGIPSGKPSARALKMYGMTQLVQEHNDNRNVFMLTATPFTNSPTEVYSMLSYIGRERLHQAGISSLRSFFDQFAQTKQELGVTSNGEIDTKQVMKNWKELPALQNILTEFIDKVDGEEAGIVRPNKFTHVKPLDMSELQHQMREMDEERMAEVKEGNSAAVIVAMNNMRLSCVAPALANPDMYEGLELPPLSQLVETSPKLKFVCDAIIDMYKDNPEKGQFMYIPLGKESHGIIKDYLVQHGIPKEAVEIINGDINNSPEKKEKITSKFNDEKDKLKIIIGGKNTSEGIDLNGNSFVMYNCSLGWNPSETIQAEGRIWRQGNLQGNVHIVYPVMNDSIDSVLYQKHDEKRSRINELWNYKGDSLNVEEINPEDLKLDLIKDPQKKAKLILEEETKDIKSELSKINLKIKDFDEIIEKRKQLSFDFGTVEDNIERYEKMVNDYKDRNLEVPEWVKVTLKNYKKEQDKANYQKENIEKKLTAWNLETEEDEAAYINNLNSQKRDCEDKIAHIVETMPEILQKLEIERMEQKVMEYPVAKQREILESDILNNLRPMKEVEYEIKTERHNKMLAEMLKAGDITKEQHDLYKDAGYEKYEKWLNGEIDSLEEKPVEPSVQSENEQSREVEEKTPAVTDEYGFEVFGEEEPSHTEKTENVNSENKNTSDNSAHTNNSNNQSDNLGDLFSGVDDDDLYIKSPEQQYFNFDSDDKYLTPEQLTQAEQKRDEIVLPILNGKESGMYNAFNTFAKKGLFDVVGTKIDIEEVPSGEPMISSTGWKQLQAAMNIYREKRFESFRYVFIDRENGEIRDQMAITCHMPNLCTASFDTSSEGTINKLIERAEQTNTMIVAVHNHPSGNTEPSYEDNCTTLKLDEELKTSDGKSLFAGHIILDHDTFSTWEPHRVNGWIQSDILEQKGKHDELLKDNFAFTGLSADNTSGLLSIADKINDVNNWNDDFIPVVFTNPQREVTGLKLYDKSFFNKEPQAIRNEFQFSGFEAGASSAFPVLTEDFMNKLGGADRFMFEEKMKDLVLHNAFTDAALPDSTIVQKYDIHAGMSFFTSHDLNKTIPEVKTTWEHRVNPTLYEQLKMGTLKVIQNEEEPQKKNSQDLSHLKKAAGMGY